MAVLTTIRNLFANEALPEPDVIVMSSETTYEIKPLTHKHLSEIVRLNLRCFAPGDNYTKHTFNYLLNEPRTLSYRVVSSNGEAVGFAFVMVKENNAAHLTTIGIAPEHRRRSLAVRLLEHLETALKERLVGTIMLEVRVSNAPAQSLYRRCGYNVVQRVGKYYNNGEDCYLMMKSLY